MEKKRVFGLDAVRAAAAVLVIAEHFFLNSSYYDIPLTGGTMALCTWLRMLFMACTPMFMMLSGYLCIKKQWKRGYLRGLLPIAAIWVLSSILSLCLRRFWLHETITIRGAISGILKFSAVPYGWYVEMYLCLFLMIPFLNAGWLALDKTGRRNITISMFVIVLLPSVSNVFGQILPEWWVGIYPIAYYIMGAWLKEYPLKIKSIWLLIGWLGFAALSAGLRWIAIGGSSVFTWAPYTDRRSAFVAAQSVCLFSLLSRCSGEHLPALFRKGVSFLAKLSLPIYLASYLSDSLLYPTYRSLLPTMKQQLLFFPVVVIIDVVLSALIAWCVNAAATALVKLIPKRDYALQEK